MPSAPFSADLSEPCFGDDPVAEPRRQKDQRTNYSAIFQSFGWLNRAALAGAAAAA
jgi:hypothetical protein